MQCRLEVAQSMTLPKDNPYKSGEPCCHTQVHVAWVCDAAHCAVGRGSMLQCADCHAMPIHPIHKTPARYTFDGLVRGDFFLGVILTALIILGKERRNMQKPGQLQ